MSQIALEAGLAALAEARACGVFEDSTDGEVPASEIDVGALVVDVDAVQYWLIAAGHAVSAGGRTERCVDAAFEGLRCALVLCGDLAASIDLPQIVATLTRSELGALERSSPAFRVSGER